MSNTLSSNAGAKRFRSSALWLVLALLVQAWPASAQILKKGMSVVTCFSGTTPRGFTQFSRDLSNFTIDKKGPVLAIFDVRDSTLAPTTPYTNWSPPALPLPLQQPEGRHDPRWTAENMGQVFGLAIDTSGNIYTAATTIYGLFRDKPSNAPKANAFGPTAAPASTNATSGNVYRIDGVTGDVTVLATLPNDHHAALGNLAYDPLFNQLFVTNFEDGGIYRIKINTNGTGTVLGPQPFYPFNSGLKGTPDSNTGFVPLGARPFGIAVWGSQLFFSNWSQDRDFGTGPNKIWYAALSPIDGSIAGPAMDTQIVIPPLSTNNARSSPISDIEFSGKGFTFLIAERTISGVRSASDFPLPALGASDAFISQAHSSRVFEFSRTNTNLSTSWTLTMQPDMGFYSNGPDGPRKNSAGGVDYAYGGYNKELGIPELCEQMIWASGDALTLNSPGPDSVYGMEGIKAGTNNLASDLFVDFNGLFSKGDVEDKTQIGDVDIFRDPCGETDCMPILKADAICLDAVNGVYQVTITFVNNNPFNSLAGSITVTGGSGPSQTIALIPPVLPGQIRTTPPFNITVPGGTGGQIVPLTIQLNGLGTPAIFCCEPLKISVTLPECRCFNLVKTDVSQGKITLAVKNNLVAPQAEYVQVSVISPANTTVTPSTVTAITPILLNNTGLLGSFTLSPAPPPGTFVRLAITLFGKKRALTLYDDCCTEEFVVNIPRRNIPAGAAGGSVFRDGNFNGVFDQTDTPIVDQPVIIGDPQGRARETRTDQFGEYQFTDLLPGVEYLIILGQPALQGAKITPSNGYRFTLDRGGSSGGNDFAVVPIGTESEPDPLVESLSRVGFWPELSAPSPAGRRAVEEIVVDGRPVDLANLPPGRHTIHFVDSSGVTRMREVIVNR